MEDRNFDLLTLALLPGLDPRRRAALLAAEDLGAVLRRPADHPDLLPEAAREALGAGAVRQAAEREAAAARKADVSIVGVGEEGYPGLLARTCDPPPVLWVKGALLPADLGRSVSIVGSRQATGAGRALAREMARELAEAAVTVVSGLALGIDGEAHRGALDGRGRTVAVLGSGLARVYPDRHAALAEQVAQSGAVVSEFPLDTPPYKANFPRRNRVIAGWSPAVVVVEAAARSGALVTARVALEEGRDVLAVPGHPATATAEGTNALIRDGALLVRGAADVAEALGVVLPQRRAPAGEPLLDALRGPAPLSVDELQRRSGLPVAALLQRLGQLEVERKVRRLPGALFVRSA
jgi:DNA processing protein